MTSEKTSHRDSSCNPLLSLPIVDSCDGCGACCMAMNSPPFLGPTDEEYLALPEAIRESYDRGMDQREADGWVDGVPCFWLDQETRKCKHYEYRPDVCRHALERNDEGCHSWRKEFSDMLRREETQATNVDLGSPTKFEF